MSNKHQILHKTETVLQLDKLFESKGVFSFLSSKLEIIDICIYKSDFILLFSDFTIIVYNPLANSIRFEIKEAKNYSPFKICIMFYAEELMETDFIVLLSETKLLLMDFSKFSIVNMTMLQSATNVQFHYSSSMYLIFILHKYKISIYSIVKNPKSLNGFEIKLFHTIDLDELIISDNLLIKNKLIIFETKSNIFFYNLNYDNFKESKHFSINKNDYFKNEFNELTTMTQYLLNSKILNKNIDSYKKFRFHFSPLANKLYIIYLNKICIVHNKYDNDNGTFEETFIIHDKITKPNIILYSKLIDPFLLILSDNRIYIYFVLDLTKCIDSIEMNNIDYSIIIDKNLELLFGLHLLNLSTNVILYNDSILVEKMQNATIKSLDHILNSTQYVMLFYSNKTIHWIYWSNFNDILFNLKRISIDFSSKMLSCYNAKILATSKDKNHYIHHIQLIKENEKFVLMKSLELIYSLIAVQDYVNAVTCFNDIHLDIIFIIILLSKMIQSKSLVLLIEYFYKFSLEKFLIVYSEFEQSSKTYDYSFVLEKSKVFIQELFEEQNETLIKLTKKIDIKSLADLSTFLKYFFNKFLQYRNDIRRSIPKGIRSCIDYDKYMKNFHLITINDTNMLNSIQEFSTLNEINEVFNSQNVTADEINLCIIENIVFLLNAYAYQVSKQPTYSNNLKQMIKSSHNILDKSVISFLQELKLEEEMLLFYYCIGNYTKCISSITEIYSNIDHESNSKESDMNVKEENNNSNDKDKENDNKDNDNDNDNENENKYYINTNEEDDMIGNNSSTDLFEKRNCKLQWLICYVKLICQISDKITPYEFNQYITWALEKNSHKTIDILFEHKKIADKKIDEDFVQLIKKYGVDPVIYYLKHFVSLDDNEDHNNEMINLYTIKLKLLFEAQEKESNTSSAKWNKDIQSTRDELCFFLITNSNYNVCYAYDKISKIPSCQKEVGIVLIKQTSYEEGIPMLFINNSNPMKTILILVEYMPVFALIEQIIKKIFSLEITDKQKTIEEMILMILEKIEHRSHLIIKLLSTDLFDEMNCGKILEFVIRNMSLMEGKRENYKIESGLVENKIMSHLNLLYDAQGRKLLITNETKCINCQKTICFGRKPMIYFHPNKYYHKECYDFSHRASKGD